jgi:hypothetical protein
MRLTPYHTSMLLAVLYRRAAVTRARISETTIRKLSGRSQLRSVFITDLRDELDDLGFAFLEIERGFALVPLSALNGAPSITAKKFLPDVVSNITKGKEINFSEIEKELGFDGTDDSEGEEA